MKKSSDSSSLGDILELILEKGVVIAGDISISLADIELLTIKIRLIIASVDKAKEIGIDWWKNDPFLSTDAAKKIDERLLAENKELKEKIDGLEKKINSLDKIPDLEKKD